MQFSSFSEPRFCFIASAILVGLMGQVGVAATTPVTTLPLGMTAFVENTAGTEIYATVPGQNEVVQVNPNTLQITGTVSTGTNPNELSLSQDGSKIYVANHDSGSIGVIDTTTFTAQPSISLPGGTAPLAVVPGTSNRLWVLSGNQNSFDSIIQVDATTGASAGANLSAPGGLIYGGDLRITPDGTTLYYGDYGLSPSQMMRFDVSGAGTNTWLAYTGGNGQDIELSHDGTKLVLICGGGNNNSGGYVDTIFNSTDASALTSYLVDPYPRCFAFSPDDKVAYTGQSFDFEGAPIKIFDLSTSTQTGGITPAADPQNLFVDNSGRYLFADIGSTTEVFATGRLAPEPSAIAAIIFLGVGMTRRRKTNQAVSPSR